MNAISHFREFLANILAKKGLLILAALFLVPISLTATSQQAWVSWDYKLLGKLNSSQDPTTGHTILITGSGSFNLSQNSISGGGSYTIIDNGGSILGSGTWMATKFDSFTPYAPGGSPGEGGHLELEALFTGTDVGGLSVPRHVVIQCSMWGSLKVGPPGYPWPTDYVEVGSYTLHKTGAVMFNNNQ